MSTRQGGLSGVAIMRWQSQALVIEHGREGEDPENADEEKGCWRGRMNLMDWMMGIDAPQECMGDEFVLQEI
eukprot:4010115-Heterocapsa_arctica.AAC.1